MIGGAAPTQTANQPSSAPPFTTEDLARPDDPRLPVDVPARITIRYAADNAAARLRATQLLRGLSQQGLDVIDVLASPERIADNTVRYFYAEDQPDAEIAARGLGPEWRPIQRGIAPREPMPRPGSLELAVGGP